MTIVDKFIRKFQAVSAPIFDKDSLTEENALEMLKAYNDDPEIKKVAGFVDKEDNNEASQYEWLLDSFKFSAKEVSENDALDMGIYMNSSEVFSKIKSLLDREGGNLHEDSIAYNVIWPLFKRCDPEDRPHLLEELERDGLMQKLMEKAMVGANASLFYFDTVTEKFSDEGKASFLENSPSFNIAMERQATRTNILQNYSQFVPLLG